LQEFEGDGQNAGDADVYEKLLHEAVYPGLQKIAGYNGGYILHHDLVGETLEMKL
jgi:hypothetical protein